MKKYHIHDNLIKKCKKGNSKAQFEIYKLYYKGMYNVSLRILRDEAEAEDVMQEAFLSAFSKLDMWSGKVTFGAWLKKIVVNKSLDYLKKTKMQLVDIDDKILIEDESFDINIEKNNVLKIDLIKNAINKLSDNYRVVALLFLFEGYTHNEISELLNITPETSRIRFMRAKKMISSSKDLDKIIMN